MATPQEGVTFPRPREVVVKELKQFYVEYVEGDANIEHGGNTTVPTLESFGLALINMRDMGVELDRRQDKDEILIEAFDNDEGKSTLENTGELGKGGEGLLTAINQRLPLEKRKAGAVSAMEHLELPTRQRAVVDLEKYGENKEIRGAAHFRKQGLIRSMEAICKHSGMTKEETQAFFKQHSITLPLDW